MIKFFRNIRRHLLSDSKFGKYFLYAIGEIILVVIGILIALQINNANEARRERAVEVNYLKNLRADLVTELRNNENFSLYRFEKAKSCTDLIKSSLPVTIADVETYTDNYEKVFIWHVFVPNNNTFKELLSSGNLSLISNDSIKNALLELETLYAGISNGEDHMRREYEKFLYDRSVEHTLSLAFFDVSEPRYGYPDRLKIEDIPESEYESLISDAQWLHRDQSFNNGIRLAMMNNGFLADIHRTMGVKIQGLLALIDEEISE